MALTAITLLCFAALLPFPGLGGRKDHSGEQKGILTDIPVKVIVTNKFTNSKISYPVTTVSAGTPMFGVLNKLQDTTTNNFTFTYTINKSFGIYLESVNGLAGSTDNHTYWELLSKEGNRISRLNVGIGCYQPRKNEDFIMNFTTWD